MRTVMISSEEIALSGTDTHLGVNAVTGGAAGTTEAGSGADKAADTAGMAVSGPLVAAVEVAASWLGRS